MGVIGRLYLGGAGLAVCYNNRPALTAEKFAPHPFSDIPGERLYDSGDDASWLLDGNLAFHGRKDDQVKIRGFRIEPGEVVAALEQAPGVSGAAILVLGETNKYLAAFVTGSTDADGLDAYLRRKLPPYMMPAFIVRLECFPLTPNGKLDRAELAKVAREHETSKTFRPPRNPLEEKLAAIWRTLLEREKVGLDDDFFESGGHSLMATRLASRIQEQFGVELPLRTLFEASRFSDMAMRLAEAGPGSGPPPITRRPGASDRAPLSFAQERLWFLTRLEGPSSAYNMPMPMRLRGHLDQGALEAAISEIIRRHESMHIRFEDHQGMPAIRVLRPRALHLEVIELNDPAAWSAYMEAEGRYHFDLLKDDLVRFKLLRTAEREHILIINMHHIVSDGWSYSVLFNEMAAYYEAMVAEGSLVDVLPEPALQYGDFAHWQREWLQGEELERQLGWWAHELADPPVLELPTDRPRPAVQTFSGGSRSGRVSAEVTKQLQALADQEQASLFMVLLAAFKILLGRLAGQDDVVVGTPIAGRNRAELESMMGFFINTLAVRTRLGAGEDEGPPSFRDIVRRVRRFTLGAYEHQDLPFARLVEALHPDRDQSRNPLFQVFFNMVNIPIKTLSAPDLEIEPIDGPEIGSKFDMTLYVLEEDGLTVNLSYNADLYDADRMEAFMEQYFNLLEDLCADPDLAPAQVALRDKRSSEAVPDPTAVLDASESMPIHGVLSDMAAKMPDRPAVVDPNVSWSYRELDLLSNRLANRLLADGLGKEDLVLVYRPSSGRIAGCRVWRAEGRR